jgi:hypothetical protein
MHADIGSHHHFDVILDWTIGSEEVSTEENKDEEEE